MSDNFWESPTPHATAKHGLLREYLKAWFPILGQWSKGEAVWYVDAFAGRGRYKDGTDGSPLIALKEAATQARKSPGRQFVLVFVERDPSTFATLESLVRDSGLGASLENLEVRCIEGDFQVAGNELLDELEQHWGPSLFFIDPYGWKGASPALMERIAAVNSSEVLVNFMYLFANQFLTAEIHGPSMRELLGEQDFENIPNDPAARAEYVVTRYRNRLKGFGFTWQQTFEVRKTGQDRPFYFMVHGTKHPRGLEVMRDALWKVDPAFGCGFYPDQWDRLDEMTLFPKGDAPERLAKVLANELEAKTLTVGDLESWVLAKTPFRVAGHLRPALLSLEQERVIAIARNGTGLKKDARVTFN